MKTDFVKLSSFKNIPDNNSQYPTEFIVANHVIILENTEDKVIVVNNDNDLLHEWILSNKERYTSRTNSRRK